MVRLIGIVLATVLAWPTVATAQKGQQVFDLLLQGAQVEAYRQQQRQERRQHRQQARQLYEQFVADWHACHAGDLGACERALSYPQLNGNDRQTLFGKRAQLIAAEAANQRRRLDIEAHERRLVIESQERRQQEARDAAHRQRAEVSERQRLEHDRQTAATATLWGGGAFGALLVMLAVCAFLFRTRLQALWAELRSAHGTPAAAPANPIREDQTLANEPVAAKPPPIPMPRDTAGAIAAMELALAYIQEVQEADRPGLEDSAERKHQLNTLALTARQLDLAERLDVDAILEGDADAGRYRFSITELKAEALLLEGMTHQVFDLKRAIPALVAATKLNPNSARAFYVLGLTHAANMSKAKAVAAFEQAVELDPKNITFRKELNRAQSLSGAEVVAYRATRAGERLVDGAATAWNIFAVIWNVTTFPLRMLVGAFRLLGLHGFR